MAVVGHLVVRASSRSVADAARLAATGSVSVIARVAVAAAKKAAWVADAVCVGSRAGGLGSGAHARCGCNRKVRAVARVHLTTVFGTVEGTGGTIVIAGAQAQSGPGPCPAGPGIIAEVDSRIHCARRGAANACVRSNIVKRVCRRGGVIVSISIVHAELVCHGRCNTRRLVHVVTACLTCCTACLDRRVSLGAATGGALAGGWRKVGRAGREGREGRRPCAGGGVPCATATRPAAPTRSRSIAVLIIICCRPLSSGCLQISCTNGCENVTGAQVAGRTAGGGLRCRWRAARASVGRRAPRARASPSESASPVRGHTRESIVGAPWPRKVRPAPPQPQEGLTRRDG